MTSAAPFPLKTADSVPWVSREQMVEADRLAMGPFSIDLLQMMEHAGAAVAEVVSEIAPAGDVVVLAGAGNNGGGGLSAARHLRIRGRDVRVVLSREELGAAAQHHRATLEAMGIPLAQEPGDAPVLVDALVGYGLTGPLRGRAAELAEHTRDRWTLSLDYPSGHGQPGSVVPSATVTLALPKRGLEGTHPLFVADIGLPPALWRELGVETSGLFAEGRILAIEGPAG